MKTIAVDIDDVVAAHVEAFIAFSNDTYGTNLTVEDYSDHWSDLWHVEQEEIRRRAKEFHTPESVIRYQRIQQADTVLQELSKNYKLVVATARPKDLIQPTFQWLDQHFAGTFSETHFVPIWEPDNTVTKADICKQIGAEYLIDDLPRHCNIAAEGGVTALLFGDYSWNRKDTLAPGVIRVKDWQEVLGYFNARR